MKKIVICYSRVWAGTLAVAFSSLLAVDTLWAQLPGIESIDVLPPNPTLADPVTLSLSGAIDSMANARIVRSPWRQDNTDILLDLLVVERFTLAPPIPVPFTNQTEIGFLPAGSYDVTARVFRIYDDPFGSDPFPEPWEFPDSFNDGIQDAEPVDTMTAQFTVVPEPPTIVIILAVVIWLGNSRTWRIFQTAHVGESKGTF